MRATIALVLLGVFAVLAVGLRSWVQWRRTGSSGFVVTRSGAPMAERVGVGLGVLAMLLAFVAPIAALAGVARWDALDNGAAAVAGAALAVAGTVLCLTAQFGMGDSWRIGVDHPTRTDLVTGGVFAVVRNPIFTSMIAATFGLALLVPNVVALLAIVLLIVGLELQVRYVEEPYLERVHGDAYRRYASVAGRFIPRVGTLHPSR